MGKRPSGKQGSTSDCQAASSTGAVGEKTKHCERAQGKNQTLVLCNPPEAHKVPFDGQQTGCYPTSVRAPQPPATQEHGHHTQNAGPGKGQACHPLVGHIGQTPACHHEREFGRSLLVLKNDSLVTLQHAGPM